MIILTTSFNLLNPSSCSILHSSYLQSKTLRCCWFKFKHNSLVSNPNKSSTRCNSLRTNSFFDSDLTTTSGRFHAYNFVFCWIASLWYLNWCLLCHQFTCTSLSNHRRKWYQMTLSWLAQDQFASIKWDIGLKRDSGHFLLLFVKIPVPIITHNMFRKYLCCSYRMTVFILYA